MNPIKNNIALPLSFFICLSFSPLLNAYPDITKIRDKVRNKDLCISSYKESYIGRYVPDNAKPEVIASVIIKIVVNNASDVSRNLKTTVLEGPKLLTPEARAKYRLCDHEVVSAMKELDKLRTAMEFRNRKSEKYNMKAAATNTEKCEKELKSVEAQLPDKEQFDQVVILKELLGNVEDITKPMG